MIPWSKYVKLSAKNVYEEMGPGYSESVYETCMSIELKTGSVMMSRQVPCTIKYRDFPVGVGFIDILFDKIPIEIKAVSKLTPKDELQVIKYLEALSLDYGLLINFGNDLEIVEVFRQPRGILTVPFDVSSEQITELKENWEGRRIYEETSSEAG